MSRNDAWLLLAMLLVFGSIFLLVFYKPLWLFCGLLILVLCWCFCVFIKYWPQSLYVLLIGWWLGS